MAGALNNFFKKFLSKKGDSVLGIDIGSSSIKVVQLGKQKGKAVLETYGELALGPYADVEIGRATKLNNDKLAEAIIDVLKEANVSTNSAGLSIPMRSSMVSVIRMPAEMDEKQLAQMIPIEARKYIPVPVSEVTLDWFLIPDLGENSSQMKKVESRPAGKDGSDAPSTQIKTNEALVVAIHNDVLNNFNTIVQNSKIDTSFFEVEMFSTIRAVLEHGENRPVLICDVGAGATKLYIVERGVVRDSHIINRGSQDITLNLSKSLNITVDLAEKMKRNYGRNEREQDLNVGRIVDLVYTPVFSEINSFMLNFQRRYNKDIAKVYLVGGGSLLFGLVEKAHERFGIETVLGDPFAKVEAPAFLQEVLKRTGLAFSTSLGLAIRKLQELS